MIPYKPGMLGVFTPNTQTIYVVVEKEVAGGQTWYKCHRIDHDTGLPMVCKDRGGACCCITMKTERSRFFEPLTMEDIEVMSTVPPTILDRDFALACMEFVTVMGEKTASANIDFIQKLMGE